MRKIITLTMMMVLLLILIVVANAVCNLYWFDGVAYVFFSASATGLTARHVYFE